LQRYFQVLATLNSKIKLQPISQVAANTRSLVLSSRVQRSNRRQNKSRPLSSVYSMKGPCLCLRKVCRRSQHRIDRVMIGWRHSDQYTRVQDSVLTEDIITIIKLLLLLDLITIRLQINSMPLLWQQSPNVQHHFSSLPLHMILNKFRPPLSSQAMSLRSIAILFFNLFSVFEWPFSKSPLHN
jgi:hypothetical protein